MAKNIPLPDKDVSIYDYLEGGVGHTIFLNPVDDQEIIRTVQNGKHKMSTDYNDINMLMVKNIITQIVRPFVHICNVSFQTGVFPDKMKIAKVVPLFKSGEKNVFTNYRPISLLQQFSKMLEKLYKQDILSSSQYGFRSNMSTSRALLELVEVHLIIRSILLEYLFTLRKLLTPLIMIYSSKNYISMVFVALHTNGY